MQNYLFTNVSSPALRETILDAGKLAKQKYNCRFQFVKWRPPAPKGSIIHLISVFFHNNQIAAIRPLNNAANLGSAALAASSTSS